MECAVYVCFVVLSTVNCAAGSTRRCRCRQTSGASRCVKRADVHVVFAAVFAACVRVCVFAFFVCARRALTRPPTAAASYPRKLNPYQWSVATSPLWASHRFCAASVDSLNDPHDVLGTSRRTRCARSVLVYKRAVYALFLERPNSIRAKPDRRKANAALRVCRRASSVKLFRQHVRRGQIAIGCRRAPRRRVNEQGASSHRSICCGF